MRISTHDVYYNNNTLFKNVMIPLINLILSISRVSISIRLEGVKPDFIIRT